MTNVFRFALELLRAALCEALGDARGVGVASVILMALSVGPEQYFGDNAGPVMIASLASFVAQYWLTRRALDRHRLRRGGSVVAVYFGMCLISALVILLGLLLLIVPGLWVAARWIAAGPALFGENVGAVDSLGRSVALTRGRVLPIMIALAIASIPSLLALSLGFVRAEYDLAASIIDNAALTVSQILFWYAAVVVYRNGLTAASNPA